MDREKTMEFLRGMKFMQRKEEAKRREVNQAQQSAALRQQVADDDDESNDPNSERRNVSSSHGSSNGPTIIPIHGSAGVALGFRTAAPRRMKFSGAANGQGVSAPKEDMVATLRQLEHEGQLGDEDGDAMYVQDVTSTVTDANGAASKRFVVSSSVRAPVMPKGLARQVNRDAAKKKRDRDEEGDDYSDPRMRF